ncbi:MAG: NAD-binding protein, partial [Muribaculaceae bacterium]|nr:NAD-binding protein [Muribaculaceae bacterium]
WVRDWFEMHDGKIIVVGVKIRENAEIVGMQLKDFAARERNFHVSAIRRRQEIIIPTGNDTIEDGDVVYFTTMAEYIEELRELCGKKLHNIRNIMIVGACRIAIRLLKLLENDDRYHLKVIDPVREQCLKISELYPGIDVVCGDYRNIDFLKDEGLLKTDAFIALSDNAEINILSCLAAKDKGVKKAVAQVESLQLMPLADQNNISTIINKKLLASSAIFQLLLDIDSNDSRCLALADAEVAEIEAMPNSKITHKLVKDLSLPRGEMTLAALIRDGVGYFINGFTQIMTGDRVVIFCRQGSLSKIEKLFK